MEKLLLGIDIGTSGCKAAAFKTDGSVAAQKTESYPVFYPNPGWAEQNPEDWWQAVCRAVRWILGPGGVKPGDIAGIGVDGQSWSAIPMDKDGAVLCNTPIWMDTRALDICSEIKETISEDEIFALCGNSLQPSYALPKVLWYQKHRPEVYRRAEKILQSNSFINFRLTGVFSQDISQGYGLQCFDMHRGQWDLAMARALGLNVGLLPDIHPCDDVIGRVTPEASAQTGLLPGTPVVAGGLDAACGTLGAGVIEPGETQEQGGQAGGMSICIDRYRADKRLILSFHVVPGEWLLQGGTVGGGGVVNWMEREFAAEERQRAREEKSNSFALMDAAAAKIPAGSEGAVFLPYLAGERSPLWDPHAKGVFFGLDFSKTRAHLYRAAMEGVAYSLRHNLDTAQEAGADAQTLYSMGGAANSAVWTQIKADVTGRRICVPSSDTATTLGAAILAGVGVGVYGGYREAKKSTFRVTKEYAPNPENAAAYQKGYGIYRKLYPALREAMRLSDS